LKLAEAQESVFGADSAVVQAMRADCCCSSSGQPHRYLIRDYSEVTVNIGWPEAFPVLFSSPIGREYIFEKGSI